MENSRDVSVGDLIYGSDAYYGQVTRVGGSVVEFTTVGLMPAGPKGDQGNQGPQGLTGPQGRQGIPGEVQLKDLPSVNLAMPDLSTATDLGGGVYELHNQNGGTLTYNVYNSEFRLFGNLAAGFLYYFGYQRPLADNAYIQMWKTNQVIWENDGSIIGFGGGQDVQVDINKNKNYDGKVPLETNDMLISTYNLLGGIDVSFKIQLEKGDTATPYVVPGQIPQYALKQQEAWITPTLLNGATGTLQYMKDTLGFVHLRGYCQAVNFTATPIFSLPVGYKPYGNQKVLVVTESGIPSLLQSFPDGDLWVVSDAILYFDNVIFQGV